MANSKQVDQLAEGVSPLVRQIISLLLEEIDTLEDGKALPPEIKLAEKFGISRKTIRVAMKRLDEEGVIRRIKRKGTFPTQGPRCRPLFRKEVKRIGVVPCGGRFPTEDNFYARIHNGIVGRAVTSACQVLLAGGNNPKDVADTCFRLAEDKGVDGIILVGFTDQQLLSDLAKWQKPICLLDHYTSAKGIDCIRTDSTKGSQVAIEHLHRLGHRRIAYADTSNESINPARLEGYLKALKDWKLEQRDEWILKSAISEGEGEDIAMRFIALPSEERPTALLTFSDSMASDVAEVFTRFGLNLPDDLSLVGTGGTLSPEEHTGLKITNVWFDWTKLGQLGVEQILERIESPKAKGQNILIPPSLNMGNSTAPPPASETD